MTSPAQLDTDLNSPPILIDRTVLNSSTPDADRLIVQQDAVGDLSLEIQVLDLNENDTLEARWFVDWSVLDPVAENLDPAVLDPSDPLVRIFTFPVRSRPPACHKMEVVVSDRGFVPSSEAPNRTPNPQGFSLTEVWYFGVFDVLESEILLQGCPE